MTPVTPQTPDHPFTAEGGERISKRNAASYFAARFGGFRGARSHFPPQIRRLLAGPAIAIGKVMNLSQNRSNPINRRPTATRHEFVIGPLCTCAVFQQQARLYYCIRCKWSFLVCGSKVAVLDADGSPLVGEDSLRRFVTFEEGPCPVLEAFSSAASFDIGPEANFRRQCNESSHLASGHVRSRSGRSRSVLRLLSRVREDLGG